MLAKLSVRNAKRSAKDYLVYILTMTVITAFMYAFNSLIFQNELEACFEMVPLMATMIGFVTVFIVWIVAWLIHYMVRFMLEWRSGEFGIYLLLGMKKKAVAGLYMRENVLLGAFSFIIGLAAGILLQQVLTAVMFSMVRMEYRLHISVNGWTVLMTALCYGGCYLLALIRCRRRFRKMNIHDLMNAKRQNEEVKEKHENVKRILLPVAVIFILVFWALFSRLSDAVSILLFLVGLVLTIYVFYAGLSAWIICYVQRKGKAVYRGQNLFLLRQFASKIKSMQFTMGTLTSLFTLALMGASIALMFSGYENTVLEGKFPFDVQVYSSDTGDDFADEIAVLDDRAEVAEYYSYHIYTDDGDQVNTWMLTHLKAWGSMYLNADKTPDMTSVRKMLKEEGVYYACDTYMGISDYNHLRAMLGYEEITLAPGDYLVQIKPRLKDEVLGIGEDLRLKNAAGDGYLSCAGICGDAFSQDGHNGADYIIVVPDEVLGRMRPYYSELVADLTGEIPVSLQKELEKQAGGEEYYDGLGHLEGDICCGSDMIITYVTQYIVRDNLIPEVKYMLASLIIPLFYVGLVFVCVAVTVLSVQQLSDSVKYKFRYDVLAKLGLGAGEIRVLIVKQLAAYYLCPAVLAIIISGKIILFLGGQFVKLTGVPAFSGVFFGKSILLLFGIYLVYFAVTYICFRRNVEA